MDGWMECRVYVITNAYTNTPGSGSMLNGQGYLLFNLKFEFVFYGNCLVDCCHFVDSILHTVRRLHIRVKDFVWKRMGLRK